MVLFSILLLFVAPSLLESFLPTPLPIPNEILYKALTKCQGMPSFKMSTISYHLETNKPHYYSQLYIREYLLFFI